MLSDALLSKGVQKFAAAPQASGGRCAGIPPLRGGFHFTFTSRSINAAVTLNGISVYIPLKLKGNPNPDAEGDLR